ncbi:hypothetical protein [Acaryochloris sp. IP29b_bin.137]|uniref:hypothetical protein n=1 Tax=Acaryochloris sp. IP29b_bin.137 TaxID=2969217 RepID=UPI002623D7A9|nr:hypothetical protein [Acaryochloris sp. IP29b_bin.137]
MKKYTKQWKILWKGRQIVVKNWWDLLLRGREELLIDGETVDQYENWFLFSRDLETKIFVNGKEHQIRAHLGSVDFGFRMGCKIFIDNQLVGGDMHKKFIT